MSTQIISFDITPVLIQAGYGIPNHVSSLGSEYTDLYTAFKYHNTDGILNWVRMLDITGGIVTGPTIFTNGLTANTFSATSINKVDYIVFNTGTTSATTVPGTVYFDNTEKALSYNTSVNQGVTVNLGQQNYLRVFNNSGLDIQKGKGVELLSSYSGLPAVQLAVNRHYNDKDVVGVSAEIIPNNSEGIILTYGIISNITVTGASIGSLVYASDTTPGEFKNAIEFLNFPLTARTNAIGYIIQTGTTTGKLFINPVNENNNLSLTDLQRNILEGNVISTGVFNFGGISLASSNTFNVGPAEGWIVDNTTNPLLPDVLYVKYTGQTNIPSLYYSSATQTYLLLTSAGTLTQQVTYPTPQQRRQSIYLAKMGHGNRTSLINAFNEPDFEVSPISQIRDMFTPIKLINENVYPSPNTGLTFNTSSGVLWGLGIGFATDLLNPSSLTISGKSPTTFQYRTQTGGTAANTTTIDPANYDLNGVITSIGSPAKQATNQRIYLLQNGQIRIQYGQTIYLDLPTAIAAVNTELFTTFSNFKDNAILIAILSVRSDATLLSDTLQAKITFASKFGESVGGTGGVSTTTLQQAYNNSATPEIVTNLGEGALTIKNGTGNADNVTSLLEGLNAAGDTTSFIRADGDISGTTIQTNGVYLNNNGITATTVSATTYLNLPLDITVTGGTFSAGTTTFTNNTGGTFSITGQSKNLALYAEYTGAITYPSPTATGVRSFAIGDGAKAISTDAISIGTAANLAAGSNNNSLIAIGTFASYNTSNSTLSTFIGNAAGLASNGSINSIMLGANAGNGNSYGNAGSYSVTAPYSIYIGNNVGRVNTTNFSGSNNVVIGNTVGVASGTTNTLNIGGVIWANGLYSNTTGYTSTSAQTIGRVGINSLPNSYALNVAGNVSMPNYLYAGVVVSSQVGVDVDISLLYGGVDGIKARRDVSNNKYSNTSGNQNLLTLSVPFYPATGNATYNIINISPEISQSGGTSGITRSLYINPTLTNAYDFRAIEVVTGKTYLKDVVATSVVISSSTQNILKVIGSGNSTSSPIFTVQGSQGELFSVSDSLTGSLFSVNDISGLPVLEAFSDNTVLMGSYLAPSLNTTVKIVATTGSTNIYSIPTSAYTGAFFDYTINDGTNLRGGNIMSIWSGSTIQYTETSTNDIGNTSGLTFNMIISGSSAILKTSGTTGSWTVKTIVRSI